MLQLDKDTTVCLSSGVSLSPLWGDNLSLLLFRKISPAFLVQNWQSAQRNSEILYDISILLETHIIETEAQ